MLSVLDNKNSYIIITENEVNSPRFFCFKNYQIVFPQHSERFSNLPFIYKYIHHLHSNNKKNEIPLRVSRFTILIYWYYNFGPAATNALPASLPVNLAKFLMKRSAFFLHFKSICTMLNIWQLSPVTKKI